MTGLARPLVLALCVLVLWVAGVATSSWYSRREQMAAAMTEKARSLHAAAGELMTARAMGQSIEVRPMSRAEAASWAYWEIVARKSGISADSFTIEPSFEEPLQDSGDPVLLSTKVTMESVTLRQILAFLYYVTEERPYVAVSAVQAKKVGKNLWDASVETFLFFDEGQDGEPDRR